MSTKSEPTLDTEANEPRIDVNPDITTRNRLYINGEGFDVDQSLLDALDGHIIITREEWDRLQNSGAALAELEAKMRKAAQCPICTYDDSGGRTSRCFHCIG